MLGNVLVAVDFSPAWTHVERWLQRVAADGCTRIRLCHVLESGYGQAPEIGHREHYERRLAEVADAIATRTGTPTDWRLRVGPAAAELLAEAGAVEADLLIVGRRGQNAAKKLLLGSTAEVVCRESRCPVLVVPV